MSRCRESRDIFQRLYQGGLTNKKALALACGVSIKTICRYINIFEREGDLTPNYKKTQNHKFTPTIRRSMVQFLRQSPLQSSTRLASRLRERWGMNFSSSGVRKVLRSMGYKHSIPKRTNLTQENKQVRFNWARNHIDTDWKRVWSFDESYFVLDPSRGLVWNNDSVYHRVARRKLTTKQEKISICIVVAISHNAKSDICYLPSNWRPNDLINVLRNDLLPSINWDPDLRRFRSLILDNDGRHHNKEVKAFLEEKELNRIGFQPTNSPDLNPVENVFGMMKRFVQKRTPSTEEELREAVIDAWELITEKKLGKLFDSMPERIQQVIANKGNRIRY
jgi:transposase